MAYFMNKFYDEDKIYRFLDELCWMPEAKRKKGSFDVKHDVEQVTFNQTKRVLGGTVAVVFYDTITMYFESREDDVRIPGWSKDGKNANPQVVLGLLVGPGDNPIGYEIHPGNTYEGHVYSQDIDPHSHDVDPLVRKSSPFKEPFRQLC